MAMTFIILLAMFDPVEKSNGACNRESIGLFVIAFLGILSSTILISARVIAIWKKSHKIIALVEIIILTQLAVIVYNIARAKGNYTPPLGVCGFSESRTVILITGVDMFMTDIILLATMLTGLNHWKEAHTHEIWHLLWSQCIIWMLFATVAHIPAMVLNALNLNDIMNAMFLPIELLTVTIVATRIYRALIVYAPHHVTRKPVKAAIFDQRTGTENVDGIPMSPVYIRVYSQQVIA